MQHWLVRGGVLRILALAVFALAGTAAHAAGIDCAKARSPTEKAICGDAGLRALDQAVAAAYADTLARAPERKDALKADLLRWLKQRDAACALPSAEIPHCLTGQLTDRLAALAPPAATPSPAAPSPAQAAAPARPADPAIPTTTFPIGAATLDLPSLPATEHAETLLHVASPGRFAIAAHSASGAALQLVDIMTGPGDEAGVAGSQDGRLDALLDVGTYKLRAASAKGASGAVALSVVPFHEAAPPAALPQPGFPLAATLKDGEQRAFWLVVPQDGPSGGSVRIEAAGRSLADLRLWRDGRELAALDPAALRIEPVAGHPLADLRLQGRVEPGTYLAIAYGGLALPWTDNDAAQPFLLRAGASAALAEGWAGGPMGPFGSEVYALPPAVGLLRLGLPAASPATLLAGDATAAIARTSREPTARLAVDPKLTPFVELRAAAGQAFTLQALEQPAARSIDKPGTYWVSAVANGAGGDELPAGVLLERSEPGGKPARIVASTVPRVGPGAAWHARFNLRGDTSFLLENTAGGGLAVRTTGVEIRQRGQAGVYDLPANYYLLGLTPVSGAVGSLDLVVGHPDAPTPPLAPLPPDPVIPLGIQTLERGQSLTLLGPAAPGLQLGLSARSVPVALAAGPLTVTQAAGTTLTVPVAIAPGGTLAVSEVGGGPVSYGTQDTNTVVVPIADHARTIVLAWRRTPIVAAIPPPPTPGASASLAAGTPAFFDLARDETRGFALDVPEGGQYRVETLGRLHMAGAIGTAFLPRLDTAEANGAGQNMALGDILRAGRYRVDVTAKESAGHLGLLATRAPVRQTATLVPGGSVRASLPTDTVAQIPLHIPEPGGRFRLGAASLGDPWTGRIEDGEGWPVTRIGKLDDTMPTLTPGAYRLVIPPGSVSRQLVLRLAAVTSPVDIAGHGPHALPFEAPQTATWREPDGRDQPRTPDAWIFALTGPADVTLRLGDGMTGTLHHEGDPAAPVRITGHYEATLEAGSYRVEATSLGRNDRLGYTIALSSTALQPGVPRTVTLPGAVSFALAEARVASLTSFGNVPVKAVLRQDGRVVARVGARADDWNIAVSRLLPAGRYTLDLSAANPPDVSAVQQPAAQSDESDSADKPDDDQEAQSPPGPAATDQPSPDQPSTDQASPGESADGPTVDGPASSAPEDAPVPKTELRLALPAALPVIPAPPSTATLEGDGVHVLSLPQPAPGTLVVAAAASTASVVVALERQTDDGWRVVALDEGVAPAVASVADSAPAAWRVEAWMVDGGSEPIRLAARAIKAAAQPSGTVTLAALDGMPTSLAVARVGLETPSPATVAGESGLLAGGWVGQALAQPNGPVLPQGRDLWLMAAAPGTATVAMTPLGTPQTIVVPPGQSAQLPTSVSGGHLALWRAEGGFGQPGLGAAAGIAAGSAVARADTPVTLRNASADAPLRVSLSQIDAELLPNRTLGAPLQATLPPGAALPVVLPSGSKTVQLDLGAGVAAFAGTSAAWAGAAPLSRTLTGDWTDIVLVNAGPGSAPASLAWQPAPAAAELRPGVVVKRFFGAAGSFETAFDAPAGARLVVAGDATLTAIAADGSVQRGRDFAAAGPGRVVVEHAAGPVAVWLAAPGVSPWPDAAAQAVQMPARLTMAGPAMALSLDPAASSLLHVSTTAPVLAAVGRTARPRLFPAGAELHALLAGPAELLLYSPTDGPLTGSVAVSADPVTQAAEGLGAPVSVAPGGAAVFGFTLAKAAAIGVGVRAEPDSATVRLLDAGGAVKGEGVAQLLTLPAGRYFIEAQVPPDAPPTIIRPALVGITPRGAGPPPDVVQHYLELVGLKPQAQGTTP